MELYVAIFLIPKTGDRIVLNGVQAEIEVLHDFIDSINIGTKHKGINPQKNPTSYLDILLTINNINFDQYVKIKKKIMSDPLFLHFKDTHPALIKGTVRSITMDHLETQIKFIGNTTDKTYHDYVAETTTQLNAEQYDLTQPNDPIDDGIVYPPEPDPGFKKKVHFNKKKDKVLKRKLTF